MQSRKSHGTQRLRQGKDGGVRAGDGAYKVQTTGVASNITGSAKDKDSVPSVRREGRQDACG